MYHLDFEFRSDAHQNSCKIADPILLMMPGESESCDGGGLGGSRPSSEMDAYGGIVSSIWVVVHPAASMIAAATIAAARVDFRIRITFFVSVFAAPATTVSASDNGFNARARQSRKNRAS